MPKWGCFIFAAFLVCCWMFRWDVVVVPNGAGHGMLYTANRITGEVRLYAGTEWYEVEKSK